MGLFTNYENSGVGIPKNIMEKNSFFDFLDIYFRKFWKLILLNMLYFIACLPVITIGPATAGFTKVLRNYSQERNAFIFHDFFDTFKKNFKQSFIIGLVDVVFILGYFFAIPTYNRMSKENSAFYVLLVICIMTLFIFAIMHYYIYLMIISTNLTLKQILKNSLILVGAGLKENAFTTFFVVILLGINIIAFPLSLFVIPFLSLSLIGLIICYNTFPVIRKFVIDPYYKSKGIKSPELNYRKEQIESQIFEDRGGEEQPVRVDKQKKSKTIS